ncbi:cupin domain-containing protein [Flavobacteriaceae bacterium SZ-1-7]|uniref:cupin domain-containing protein n=1 Tax=Tamlana sedimenti TaxID=3134126 RepID=UPI003122AB5D
MRHLFILSLVFLCGTLAAQNQETPESGEKVIIDNDKIKVIEHFSLPQGDVCGLGMHYHEPHLTIVLTDAKVKITPENGDAQEIEVESGTSIWFGDADTHAVINSGDQPTKMILVYLKE